MAFDSLGKFASICFISWFSLCFVSVIKMEILCIIMHCCCCYVHSEDNSWSQPEVSGSPPCSRHGHVSVTVGTDIYIHGGMAGTDMFDDLYKFDTGMKIKQA